MKLLITTFVILFGLISPSFGKTSEVEVLENMEFPSKVLISRICVGGYEFVLVCYKDLKKERCEHNTQSDPASYQLTQIITENGGGKKC